VTQYLPKDIGEWMREQEKRVQALERRRIPSEAWMASPFVKNVPRWQSRLAANASIASGVLTNIGFTSTYAAPYHAPTGSNGAAEGSFLRYDTATGAGEPRYYALQAGLYFIRANIQWNGNATGSRKIHIIYDGDGTASFTNEVMNAGAGFGIHQEVTGILPLAEGDYFRIALYQASGASINIVAAGAGAANTYAASKLNVVPLGGLNFTPV
jgi:hypothetical protein